MRDSKVRDCLVNLAKCPGDRRNDAARRYLAYAIGLGDVDVAVAIYGHREDVVEVRLQRGPVLHRRSAAPPGARECRDVSVGDFAHAQIAAIGNVVVAAAVEHNALRRAQKREDRRAAIAAKARAGISLESLQLAIGLHADDAAGRALYATLIERLPRTIILSIDRRTVLRELHARTIEMRAA